MHTIISKNIQKRLNMYKKNDTFKSNHVSSNYFHIQFKKNVIIYLNIIQKLQ